MRAFIHKQRLRSGASLSHRAVFPLGRLHGSRGLLRPPAGPECQPAGGALGGLLHLAQTQHPVNLSFPAGWRGGGIDEARCAPPGSAKPEQESEGEEGGDHDSAAAV